MNIRIMLSLMLIPMHYSLGDSNSIVPDADAHALLLNEYSNSIVPDVDAHALILDEDSNYVVPVVDSIHLEEEPN